MKKSDLSENRQRSLVKVEKYPGAFAIVPSPTPRRISLPSIQNEVARAHEALGALNGLAQRLPNPDLITRTLDRREAVRSSQMEGTGSDMNDLFAYEATGSEDGLPPDVVVTLNYVKSLDQGLLKVRAGHGTEALTSDLIKEVHANLMDGVRDFKGVPGEFRTIQNWIGGMNIYQAKIVPPPADYILDCMKDLELYLQNAYDEEAQYEVPLVIRMAIAHAQFETIHPFVDGNGRVGRILMPLMLAAEGYPPVYLAGYLKENQRAYFDGLGQVQLQEKWTEWVSFFATSVTVAANESMQTANRLLAVLERWKRVLAEVGFRSDAAISKLPEVLIGRPVVTTIQVKEMLDVSFPAASNALSKLEELGILQRPTQAQRNRVFVAGEVIDVLNRPVSDVSN